MTPDPSFYPTHRDEWREWLREHHASQSEIWVVFYKKHTGKATLTYAEAVEEALCFGWIDSMDKGIDEERYAQRFTPRRKRSNWSESNRKRVLRLIDEERMTEAGLDAAREWLDRAPQP
jgi:uncharacterized protein YdeI (YjbR/CyaY-like superfamily)